VGALATGATALVAIGIATGECEPFTPSVTARTLMERHALPHASSETIPTALLIAIAFFLPLASTCTLALLAPPRFHRALRSASSLGATLGLSMLFTNTTKACVGKYRPDFVLRCFPSSAFPGSLPPNRTIVDPNTLAPQCDDDADPYVLADGRKSFPSGHASLAAAGLAWLALSLHEYSTEYGFISSKSTLSSWNCTKRIVLLLSFFVCFLLAALVAASRLQDNRHFPEDVLAGLALGSLASAGTKLTFSRLPLDVNQQAKFNQPQAETARQPLQGESV